MKAAKPIKVTKDTED